MEFLLILGAMLIIGGIVWGIDRWRTQIIQSVADEWGYEYYQNGRQRLPLAVSQSNLFSRGRNGRLRHLIQREQSEVTVSIGEYGYTTGSGKNKKRHRQTVVFIESPKLSLPQFLLLPENILHKIGKIFGFQDIDFSSHPTFSKRYLLQGQDESSIRSSFHEGVLDFFEGRKQRVCVEGAGSMLMYYYAGRLHNPRKWQQIIAIAFKTYEQFCRV